MLAIREFNTSLFERPLKQHQRGLPRTSSVAFKYANCSDTNVGSVCELLLSPVQQASRRPALRSCDHYS